jgi:MFS family permease
MNTLRIRWLAQYGRETLLISLAQALLSAAFLGVIELLIVLYALRLGHGPDFVGLLGAAAALSFSLFSLPGSALGRRHGVRSMMIAGAAATIIGMALLPLAESVPQAIEREWLLLSRVVSAGGWSILMVNQIAALAAYTGAESRKRAYALKEGSAGLGMLVGTLGGGMLPSAFACLLGGTTADPAPYRYGLCTSILLGLVGLIPLTLLAPTEKSVAESTAQTMPRAALAPLAALTLCAFLNHSAVASGKVFYSAYMDQEFGMSTSIIGLISGVGMSLAIAGALGSARLARDRSSGYAMLSASLGLLCSLLLMAVWDSPLSAALGAIGTATVRAVWLPAYQALQMEVTPASAHALVAGICSMAMSLGWGTMSFGGGYLVSAFGYRWVFLVGGVAAGLSATLMWSLLCRQFFAERV